MTCHVFHVWVVQVVTNQWITEIFHMNTDLVGAAGLKTKRDKAVPICFFYHFIMGDCIFSMFPVYGPFDDGSFLAPERSLDGSFGRCDRTSCNREILPVDFPVFCHVRENTATDQMLGHNGKSRSIPVQTVATPENERFSLRLKVVSQSICYRVCVII